MKERCKPPNLEDHDWNQFDFTRWNLDAVAANGVARAIAGLTQQFFESPEWQENVQASIPQIQQVALGIFKDRGQQLRESRAAAEVDFENRAVSAKQRSDAVRRAVAAAAAPQVPEITPDAYHLAVRVTGADPQLGFEGLVVEIADPRNENAAPIASASTDVDGNATLTVGPELATELDKRDATISVTSPSGKVLVRLVDGVCVRRSQVETKVLTVKESAETAPLKEAALETRASRERLQENLDDRVRTLAADREARLANIDCRLRDADILVEEIEKPVDLAELFARVKPREPTPPGAGPAPGRAPPVNPAPTAPPAPPANTAPVRPAPAPRPVITPTTPARPATSGTVTPTLPTRVSSPEKAAPAPKPSPTLTTRRTSAAKGKKRKK